VNPDRDGDRAKPARIGIDLDNTIVCYDRLFHQLAVGQGLAPHDAPTGKHGIREHLRATGREDAWTKLQGQAYGPEMHRADAFPGAVKFIGDRISAGCLVYIVSHRSRHPYLGPPHDLHAAALAWLEQNGLTRVDAGLPRERIFLELTREAKLRRIAELECTHFIDDLPEFLTDQDFPPQTERVLFDPHGAHLDDPDFVRADSWQAITRLFAPSSTERRDAS
jgi:hypothetical protein